MYIMLLNCYYKKIYSTYSAWEDEIMATQSFSEGFVTPVTVTVIVSSSEMLEPGLTFICIDGFKSWQRDNLFRFTILNSDIAVWFLCSIVVSIKEGNNVEEDEEEKKPEKIRRTKKILDTWKMESSIGDIRSLICKC